MNRFLVASGALPTVLLISALPGLTLSQTVISVNVAANRQPINPLIYGAAFPTTAQVQDLNCPISRFGGNEASSYNWEANAAAKGTDWYFESWPNDSSSVPGEAVDSFISTVKAGGALPLVTLPMLQAVGIVSPSRTPLWSFSVAKYGPQTASDPDNADAGNGISTAAGNPFINNNPKDANTPNSLSMQQSWLTHLISTWGLSNAGGVQYYVMDNEPSIWHSTHRDVHPIGETYNELYQDYLTYAGAIRAADPNAIIAGPEEWGWTGYLYSGYDQQYAAANGWNSTLPDYSSHNNMYHVPWLLQSLKQYQTTSGKQLLNVLSLHYYPQQGEFSDDDSAAMQVIRNRSTRSLWDPNYVDTSWINSVVMLIPRMKGWVSSYYPGLKTAITEYNWGDEGEMNGATAQADIYGIFGQQGLDMASRWTTPATNSPAYLAMKMYRNYDGNKSTFGDTSVSCTVPDPDYVSAFAAQRTVDGALTLMVINKLTTTSTVKVEIAGFSPLADNYASIWQISPTYNTAIKQLSSMEVAGSGFSVALPAQSVTLYVLNPVDAVASLTLKPVSVAGGASSVGTVTLNQVAPTGGWTVKLGSQYGTSVIVPPSITIPAGSTTGTFPITTRLYAATYTDNIEASDLASDKLATLTVIGVPLAGLTVSPTTVLGGTNSTGTVTLTEPAPSGGVTVTLGSQYATSVIVPATVTVPAGKTSATFTITTRHYSSGYTNYIEASDTVNSESAKLTITS